MGRVEKDIDILKSKLIAANYKEEDIKKIMRAAGFGKIWHEEQKRASGEPYFIHPIKVASILIDLNMDADTVVAGLLHDSVEDTDITLDFLKMQFGESVANLIDGVTKISILKAQSKSAQAVETIRKIMIAMAKDIRVIIIKLADRVHNMRTLNYLRPDKQKRISRETLDIYAPLAGQLCISGVRAELEDLSFKYLNPEMYKKIKQFLSYKKRKINAYLEEHQRIIKEAAAAEGIEIKTEARAKSIYSIYRKMKKYDTEPSGLYDLIGLRIYCNTVTECYALLSIVHGLWEPIGHRLKDYISVPKPNGYQSLHTAVIAGEGKTLEVQIRTHAMHIAAEYGIAAHWLYKTGKVAGSYKPKDIALLNRLKNWNRINEDQAHFLDDLKEEILKDTIFVFTPNGDAIELPTGSTAIDFAYHIHTEIGNHCMAAKADGVIIPLSRELKNAQSVEIITNASVHPNLNWLRTVKSARAKGRIRAWLNKNADLHIGNNIVVTKEILPKPDARKALPRVQLPDDIKNIVREVIDKNRVTLKVGGEKNMLITMARCCSPSVGDEIVGYVSVGRGVIVHKKDCPNLKGINQINLRMINVEWETVSAKPTKRYKVVSRPSQDIFSEIEGAVKKNHGHVIEGQLAEESENRMTSYITIEIDRKEDFKKAVKNIKTIPSVLNINEII